MVIGIVIAIVVGIDFDIVVGITLIIIKSFHNELLFIIIYIYKILKPNYSRWYSRWNYCRNSS